MPTVVVERWDSGRITLGGNESGQLIYAVGGVWTEAEAVALVLDETPLLMTLPSGTVLEPGQIECENVGGDNFTVTIEYTAIKPREPGDFDFSFDTSGGTQKITSSIKTLGKYAPPGETPPDVGGIGDDGENVEGVEIPVASFKWTETHYLPLEQITFAYSKVLKALTGKTNNKTFRTHPKGTVVFDGAQGGKKDAKMGQVTFNFRASDDAEDLSVGNITGISKPGWAYLWIRYKSGESANKSVKKPAAVYVEQVLREADFALLGIGEE